MKTVKNALQNHDTLAKYVETFDSPSAKDKLIKNGGIESVWQGQKRITMPDGSMWFYVAGNTFSRDQ